MSFSLCFEQIINLISKKTEFPDGYIREAQFVKIFKELYNHGHPEKFAKFAFSAFDQDHNGKIGFDVNSLHFISLWSLESKIFLF